MITEALAQSFPQFCDLSLTSIDGGHISSSYALGDSLILQRISRLFNPKQLAINYELLNQAAIGTSYKRDYVLPEWLKTQSGEFYFEYQGDYWRVMRRIRNDKICDVHNAKILATFLRIASETEHPSLLTKIVGFNPDFQNISKTLPNYLTQITSNLRSNSEEATIFGEVSPHLHLISNFPYEARSLVHGDPKRENFTEEGLIDFDTLMIGSPLYDYGDFMRSAAIKLEDSLDDDNFATPDHITKVVRAFSEIYSGDFFTESELRFLSKAPRAIALNLGLRFLADHLQNNQYFGAKYSGQNLTRAKVMIKVALATY